MPLQTGTVDRTRDVGEGAAGDGDATGRGISDWLCLAAAPTFAIMALLAGATGDASAICSSMHDAWSFGGMVPMYVLMSIFHSAPWLKLLSGKGGALE